MRRTKIVCTIGPATENKSKINMLIRHGMNVARLNFSHGSYAWFAKTIKTIRSEAAKLEKPIAILQDLCGPKIRLGDHPSGGIQLKSGDQLIIAYHPDKELTIKEKLFPCSIDLSKYLHKGQIILLDDGRAQLEVIAVNKPRHYVKFNSLSNHFLKSRKGINLPNIPLDIPSLTAKDIKDIIFGIDYQPEYIALSFVKNAKDIDKLKSILTKHKIQSHIIAKIETPQSLENIDQIIAAADGVMVARGDLGLETPIEQLPLVQKHIIRKCLIAHKPVIVATQMLASMTTNPIPTRAEASDVANAVFDHTSAVMLSEESAIGNFPIKAVHTLAKICQTTDEHLYTEQNGFINLNPNQNQIQSLAYSACNLAINTRAKFIIVPTFSGQTAKIISSHRPPTPIIAATFDQATFQRLSLNWGITPILIPGKKIDELITHTLHRLLKSRLLKKGDRVIIVTGSNLNHHTADQLLIKTI